MKNLILSCTLVIMITGCAGCSQVSCQSRDFQYEHYCDSIWQNDPDYYVDVLSETDQYQEYITQHGAWWPED